MTTDAKFAALSAGLEPLLSAREVADYLGVPLSTLYDWRLHGQGPAAYRLGKHLKYAVGDVATWLEAQRDGGARPAVPRSIPPTPSRDGGLR
jgi:excisionase family DNA binding protein